MRILVVDDDVRLVRDIEQSLTRQAYIVDTAVNGRKAWECVQTRHYDLIVLDVVLPGLDGRRLCERLRQNRVSTPILLLTVRESSQDKVAGLDAGADDYMVKPFDWDELLARIRALCRRESTVSPLVLTWGALTLNPQTCQVSYAGERVPLRRQEYRLLELFLRHPTRVFSCNSIIEQLWPLEDEPPLAETVRAHIKSLRRKLKLSGAADVIQTVYGLGYRLQDAANLPTDVLPTLQGHAEAPPLVYDTELVRELRRDLTTLWHEIQPEVVEQVCTLEGAIQLLSAASDPLLALAYQQAIATSHKLAGTVGSYGFKRASQLARQIETLLLDRDRYSNTTWADSLQEQVMALRQDLALALVSVNHKPELQNSDRDRLTQLLNRVKFTHDLESLLQQAGPHNIPISLCILEIQNLKAINHQYGYAVGDQVLQAVADHLRQVCSTDDLVSRWAGRKFAVALYNHPKPQAQKLFSAIVKGLKVREPAQALQISIGQFPEDGRSLEELYRAVEQ